MSDVIAVGNATSEEGSMIYNYIRWVVLKVVDCKIVTERTVFNAEECVEIKAMLLAGTLDCFFTDVDNCEKMSVSDFLKFVFRYRHPVPDDLPQYQ